MASIGIIYGSNTGATEDVALSMGEKLGISDHVHDIATCEATILVDYDVLILGIPTWNIGDPEENWEFAMKGKLKDIDLSGKTIALFGLGDAEGYPETYQDAVAILYDYLAERGAPRLIGKWPTEGYEFDASRAVDDEGMFLGLALDNDNESELTDERVDAWLKQVRDEIAALA